MCRVRQVSTRLHRQDKRKSEKIRVEMEGDVIRNGTQIMDETDKEV